MSPSPAGTVTFLFTDVERSTQMWDQFPELMRAALARHDSLIGEIARTYNGTVVKERGEGDSQFLTFESAVDAARAALAIQNRLRAEVWPPQTPIKVRMALHTGEAHEREGDYYGGAVNRCARIRAVGYGGQSLLSEVTAGLVRDHLNAGACLRDHGLHHLKDLQRPEHIFELRGVEWPDDFGPLRSLAAFKHNLPLQLTSFIAREQELNDIRKLLKQTRLLTLTGSGGSGKTRLGLQTGAEVVDDYPDGVWLVELAPLGEGELVAQAIAGALGIKDEPGRDLLQTLCDALRERALLLLLDNCEHVIEAAARVARRLLQACPKLCILATSQSPLKVGGEIPWRVPSLSVPGEEAGLDVESALRHAGLRLFVERATSAYPAFALTGGNLPAVTRICRHLDGIPLAIELAAARVNAYTPEQIDSRLHNRFKLLVGGGSGVPPRHETLRALIDWSHDLLAEREKALLRRLSVFAGGWTLESAEAVCEWGELESDDALDLLPHLVDASLVIADEQEGARRYRLLESVREYAALKLEEAGETEAARESHLRRFVSLAEEAEPKLTGAEQSRWLKCLEAEHDNLRAALKWAVDNDTRLRLAAALWRFWSMRSHFQEGRGWLNGALARSPQADAALRAKALNGLGVLATRQAEYEEARRVLEESLGLSRSVHDPAGMAEALNNLAIVANAQGQSEEARGLYLQSLDLWRNVGNKRGIAAALNNLGILFINAGDYKEAHSYFAQSLAICRERDDRANMASMLGNLGAVCCCLEDYAQARRYYEEGLAIDIEFGNRWGAGYKLVNLGDIARRQRDFAAARRFLRDSLKTRMALNDKSGCAFTLDAFAELLWDSELSEQSVVLMGAAQALWEAAGAQRTEQEQEQNARLLAAASAGMSPDTYAALWAQGTAMTLEQVSAYVESHTAY